MGGDAEQPQEGELDHAYRGALRVHVGELGGRAAVRASGGGWAARAGNRRGAERNARVGARRLGGRTGECLPGAAGW